jgi:hypothetical protein
VPLPVMRSVDPPSRSWRDCRVPSSGTTVSVRASTWDRRIDRLAHKGFVLDYRLNKLVPIDSMTCRKKEFRAGAPHQWSHHRHVAPIWPLNEHPLFFCGQLFVERRESRFNVRDDLDCGRNFANDEIPVVIGIHCTLKVDAEFAKVCHFVTSESKIWVQHSTIYAKSGVAYSIVAWWVVVTVNSGTPELHSLAQNNAHARVEHRFIYISLQDGMGILAVPAAP